MGMTASSLLAMVALIACTNPIASSHIEANVPNGKLFDEYLKRDLEKHFCSADVKQCQVKYELLRKGPTQTGISYPKYYVWLQCFSGDKLLTEGAARVAAMEQEQFDLTHFLTRKQILEDPEQVATIFPAALQEKILYKARGR
jgi:hypothetical protein